MRKVILAANSPIISPPAGANDRAGAALSELPFPEVAGATPADSGGCSTFFRVLSLLASSSARLLRGTEGEAFPGDLGGGGGGGGAPAEE